MKAFLSCSVLLVLSCVAVGCSHRKAKATPPPQAQAPETTTENPKPATPAPIPPPTLPPYEEPSVVVDATPPPKQKKNRSKKTTSINKQVATDNTDAKPASGAATAMPETASSGSSPAATPSSPIGDLSAGDSSDNPAQRQETMDLISSTEKRLKTVDSNIAASKHDTMVQIESFLKQAKQALEINDLQGANTLATKAKILVDELLKQ